MFHFLSHFSGFTGFLNQTLPDEFLRIPTLQYLYASKSILQTHTTSFFDTCFFLISRLLSLFCIHHSQLRSLFNDSQSHSSSLSAHLHGPIPDSWRSLRLSDHLCVASHITSTPSVI